MTSVGHSLAPLVLRDPHPAHAGPIVPPTFDDVYDNHFSFVWRTVRRLGVPRHAVDDAVQEVFVVVHRRLADFEGRSSVKTWLTGITLRVASEHRRRARKNPTADVDAETLHAGPERRPDDAATKAEALRVLHGILDQMDDDRRDVFVMAELEEMTVPEIAESLGTNVNTVYSRLRTARQEFDQAVSRHRTRDAWRLR